CGQSGRALDCVRSSRCVRLGHPARQLPQVVEHSLDALLARSEDRRIIADFEPTLTSCLAAGLSCVNGEANCVKAILTRAQAVLCTLTVGGLNDDSTLKEIHATEAACWLAYARAPKCIPAGDPYQLPRLCAANAPLLPSFAVTLMERLLRFRSAEATQLLDCYSIECIANIMLWSSLIAHQSVAGQRLADLPELRRRVGRWRRKRRRSTYRPWLPARLAPSDIAVISPYRTLQVEHIHLPFNKQQQQQSTPSSNLQSVEVRSVDGFQGREKEAVIISLVRSNRQRIVGFLSEPLGD
uniref:AAA_12 domain-containing protein n=1 Tax=Macrostomum lignano TaxID=282301 RepID=A0A1I8FCS8_9PLAT